MVKVLKKIFSSVIFSGLLFLLIIILITPNVFANDYLTGFYLKSTTGTNFVNKISEDRITTQNAKFSPFVEVGVGYYFNDKLRSDIVLSYNAIHFKRNLLAVNETFTANIKNSTVIGIMLNGYVNLFEVDKIMFFSGAGIGMVRIYEESEWLIQLSTRSMHGSLTKKPVTNLVYNITLGTTISLNNNIALELSYNIKDFGTTPRFNDPKIVTGNRKHLKVQCIAFGTRINI